jgi:xanthine dehydrogenase accessory factor
MLCGGRATLFYERLGSPANVIIFGGGHVGRALAYHLRPQDVHTLLVDTRDAVLEDLRRDGIAAAAAEDYRGAAADRVYHEDTYCVIATHSHEEDYRVLKAVIESSRQPAYIGVIASARKAREFHRRLEKECETPLPRGKLYMPCGLDTGGPTPHEIAISIAAEIQAVRFARSGHRHMRERLEND